MESYNKQFRRANWTPECINPRGGRRCHIRDPWLFMQTNWKLSSNLTFDLQQCTSMYVLRNAQKSTEKPPTLQSIRLSTVTRFIEKWMKLGSSLFGAKAGNCTSDGNSVNSLSFFLCCLSDPTWLTHWHIQYHTHSIVGCRASPSPRLGSLLNLRLDVFLSRTCMMTSHACLVSIQRLSGHMMD